MRKKKNCEAALVMMLCLILVITGCSSGSAPAPGAAMGRFVEEELPLPEELMSMGNLSLNEEGAFTLWGRHVDGHWKMWESWNGGQSWSEYESPWSDYLNSIDFVHLTVDEEGRVWIMAEDISYIDDDQIVDRGMTKVDGEYLMVREGSVAVIDRVGAVYDNRLERWLIRPDYDDDYLQEGSFFMTDDRYALAGSDSMKLYELESGQLIQEIPFQKSTVAYQAVDFFDFSTNRTLIAETPEKGVYSYVNSSGIYRVSEDGMIHERLVAGDMTSLIMPTMNAQQLFAGKDAYYVYATDKDSYPWEVKNPVLLRYRYDETVAAVPASELRVYSLHDSPTVREAMGLFQREHPDIKVNYEVGADSSRQIGEADAVRLLTTELLTGKGPDVILLDGLRMEDYMKKGILADLNELLPDRLKEAVLGSLADAFSEDSVLHGIPTRFTVTMILADEETAAGARDPEWLADCLTSLDSPQIGVSRKDMFDLFYSMYSELWFDGDGSLDVEAAAVGFAQIKRITDLYAEIEADWLWNAAGDWRVASIGWRAGWTPLYVNQFTSVEQLVGPGTVLQEKEGVFAPFSSSGQPALTPAAIAGIYSESPNKEEAAQFIEAMLSDRVQGLVLGDGLPVMAPVLKTSFEKTPSGGFQRYGVSFYDGFEGGAEKGLTIPMYWPEKAYFDDFTATVEGLPVKTTADGTVKQMVAEAVSGYLSGIQSLDETVKNLNQKLSIYLAE